MPNTKYQITNYTFKKAQKMGLVVKPSTNQTKKIDVFKKVLLVSHATPQANRPARSSSMAAMICSLVFITNGPY